MAGCSISLVKLDDELRYLLITSYARVHHLSERPDHALDTEENGLAITVRKSLHAKCSRCWHHREDVGSYAAHPELCGRCVENIEAAGETRRFA